MSWNRESPACDSRVRRASAAYRALSACARGACTAGPRLAFSIRNWIIEASMSFAIWPPRASISRTRFPLAIPPMAGLHDMRPIGVEVLGHQDRRKAQPRQGERRLDAGVAGADHHGIDVTITSPGRRHAHFPTQNRENIRSRISVVRHRAGDFAQRVQCVGAIHGEEVRRCALREGRLAGAAGPPARATSRSRCLSESHEGLRPVRRRAPEGCLGEGALDLVDPRPGDRAHQEEALAAPAERRKVRLVPDAQERRGPFPRRRGARGPPRPCRASRRRGRPPHRRHRSPRASFACLLFPGIGRRAQAGSVEEPHGDSLDARRALQPVARRSMDLGDDGPVLAEQES